MHGRTFVMVMVKPAKSTIGDAKTKTPLESRPFLMLSAHSNVSSIHLVLLPMSETPSS